MAETWESVEEATGVLGSAEEPVEQWNLGSERNAAIAGARVRIHDPPFPPAGASNRDKYCGHEPGFVYLLCYLIYLIALSLHTPTKKAVEKNTKEPSEVILPLSALFQVLPLAGNFWSSKPGDAVPDTFEDRQDEPLLLTSFCDSFDSHGCIIL